MIDEYGNYPPKHEYKKIQQRGNDELKHRLTAKEEAI